MSKIPKNLDNPIDNILIAGVEIISDPLHHMGITPNMLTATSLVTGMAAAYSLHKRHYERAAVLTLLAYFLDCADGYVARKYNQVTVFGDWFDHTSDVVKVGVLLWVMYKVDKNKFYRVLPVITIFAAMQAIHFGCQERVYAKENESTSLGLTKPLCPGDPHKHIKFTRYVGCGTFITVLILCILYFKT